MLQNLHRRIGLCSASQIYDEDFAKFCGLLRICELYLMKNLGDHDKTELIMGKSNSHKDTANFTL